MNTGLSRLRNQILTALGAAPVITIAAALVAGCGDQDDKDVDTAQDMDADPDANLTCPDVHEVLPEDGADDPAAWLGPFLTCGPLPEPESDPIGALPLLGAADSTECPPHYTLDVDSFLDDAWGGPCATPEDQCLLEGIATCGPELSRSDACCYVIDDLAMEGWDSGRPFRVNGEALQADCIERDNAWSEALDINLMGLTADQRQRLAQAWLRSGQAEHASVAAFARVSLQLMAVGAPATLLVEATRAQADEIRHARTCMGIASAAHGEVMGLGAISMDHALDDTSIETMLVDTIREGCVNETISAAGAQAAAEAASEPTIRQALQGIAEDEQRHATLAWRTVRWILETRPVLRDLAEQTFAASIEAEISVASIDAGSDLRDFGCLSAAEEAAVFAHAMAQVVVPCAAALFNDEPAEIATV